MNIAIIFAGGIGVRMKSTATPKQFLDFQGKPLIVHVLEKFEYHDEIDMLVIACLPSWIDRLKSIISTYHFKKISAIVEGGDTSQQSIYHALQYINHHVHEKHTQSVVLIHDGVRPIFSKESISECILKAREVGGAIATVPATETIITSEDGLFVQKALDRNQLHIAQAPQCFLIDQLFHCHQEAQKKNQRNYVDSCSLYLDYFPKVAMVQGLRGNIKVTVPEDYFVIKGIKEFYDVREIEGY